MSLVGIFNPDQKPTPPLERVLAKFADFVVAIDAGRLDQAELARRGLERMGFDVTYRRRARKSKGAACASL
jgi:hypothetical protein